MIAVKVVGVTWGGTEIELGVFSQGVVIKGTRIHDVASMRWVVDQHHRSWVTPVDSDGRSHNFMRVFVQAAEHVVISQGGHSA